MICDQLIHHADRHGVLRRADIAASVNASGATTELVARLKTVAMTSSAPIITSGEIARGRIRIKLDAVALSKALNQSLTSLNPDVLKIDAPFGCRRRGVEMIIVAGDPLPTPDPAMIRALRNAHLWATDLRGGATIACIAQRRQMSKSYVARVLPLACLSPRIQTAIFNGTQPINVNLETLVRSRLPLGWDDQERMLGFVN